MDCTARILVAEPLSMMGRAIRKALARCGLRDRVLRSARLDLTDSQSVEKLFARERPTHVFLAAGKKGGIQANQRSPAELMLNNLRISTNVLDAALRYDVEKLLYVGSSCMYPRDCWQPASEDMLLTGRPEPTNEPYAVAKLAAWQLCRSIQKQHSRRFITAIPTNIYGPFDCFDPDNAHVIGALIHRIATAKQERQAEVAIWGTGNPRRQFLFSDDFGTACVLLMRCYDGSEPVNIGGSEEVSIRELAEQIRGRLGYEGCLRFDASKPDGAPRKSLDGRKLIEMGWRPTVSFADGLRRTCRWYEQSKLAAESRGERFLRGSPRSLR